MLPKESQTLEETLAEAQRVLKEAHSKGVELECILEVKEEKYVIAFMLFKAAICNFDRDQWLRKTKFNNAR